VEVEAMTRTAFHKLERGLLEALDIIAQAGDEEIADRLTREQAAQGCNSRPDSGAGTSAGGREGPERRGETGMSDEQKPESKKYAPEIMGLAVRVYKSIEEEEYGGEGLHEFEKLVDAGLMREGIYDGEFPSDTLEIGEPMWGFTPEGLNAIRLFKEGARQ